MSDENVKNLLWYISQFKNDVESCRNGTIDIARNKSGFNHMYMGYLYGKIAAYNECMDTIDAVIDKYTIEEQEKKINRLKAKLDTYDGD